MKDLFLLITVVFLISCSSTKVKNVDVKSKYGIYRLRNIACIIPDDRKSYCSKWKYIQILNPKDKFVINSNHALVSWDKHFDLYQASSLKNFIKSSDENAGVIFRQNSESGYTKLRIDANNMGTYISDYNTHHEGRVMLKYKLEKLSNVSGLKIKYPGGK